MITDVILYTFSFLLGVIGNIAVFLSQGWSIWPPSVLNGFTYFFTTLMSFNIILPIKDWLGQLLFLMNFDAIYVSIKLLMRIFNFVRGSGEIKV